jgi:CHAT domain-containing protein
MNVALLQEMQELSNQIQLVQDGLQLGDPDALTQSMLNHVAGVAGAESLEYGLVLRTLASRYRSKGESEQAIATYTHALDLIEKSVNEALMLFIATIVSLGSYYRELGQLQENALLVTKGVERLGQYAGNPDQFHFEDLPKPPSPVTHVAALAQLLSETAATSEQALNIFDALVQRTAQPAVQLGILLGRGSLERSQGSDPAGTCDRAIALVHNAPADADWPSAGQWVAFGRLTASCGRAQVAKEAAMRLRGLPAKDDAESVANNYHALEIEAVAAQRGLSTEEAEAALGRLLDFSQVTFGSESEQAIAAETQFGLFLVDEGKPAQAIGLLRRAINAQTGTDDYEVRAKRFFNFGLALDKNGNDTEAMDYYNFAWLYYSASLGPTDPASIVAAISLAETARIAHDLETAERVFRSVIRCERDAERERSPNLAHALNNLAETLMAAGRAQEAAPLAEEALDIRKERFGIGSSEFTRSLAVVVKAAVKTGDRARAGEAIGLFQSADHPHAVQVPGDLAVEVYRFYGENDRAIETCRKGIEAAEASTGQGELVPRQDVALRSALVEILMETGRLAEARKVLHEIFDDELPFLSDEAGVRSQRQIHLLLEESRSRIGILLETLDRDSTTTDDDIEAAYKVIQQRRSIETRLAMLRKLSFIGDRALTSVSQETLDSIRSNVAELVEELKFTRRKWMEEALELAARGVPDPEDETLIACQDRMEYLERRLGKYVGPGSRDWEIFGIRASIPHISAGNAVVEYYFSASPAPVYYVFVLTSEGIHFLPLGEADVIHQNLKEMRTQIIDFETSSSDTNPPWARRARFLRNRLLSPILPLLEGVSRLYIVPDSELFTLPFDLLPTEDGQTIDHFTISHLWHGSELSGSQVFLGQPPRPAEPLVVSAPDMAAGTTLAKLKFADLPAAKTEGDQLASRLGANHLEGPGATKEAVTAAQKPEIVHFATHSFYIPYSKPGSAPSSSMVDTPLFRARSILRDPMRRSGIALAGADPELNAPTASSPGILFAEEVLDLDLRDTDLAVLSTCQSGLGDPLPGDGIQGLRRAFRAAGVKSVVSSLWKVPDEATREFMLDFYDRLLNKVPRAQALQEAKLELRKKYKNDPLYWAGFVLDGPGDALFRFNPIRGLTIANFSGIALTFESGLEHRAARQWDEAIKDFETVIQSNTAEHDLRADAKYERAGALRLTGRLKDALDAYDEMISNLDTPPERQLSAMGDRALTKQLMGDAEGAYLDYTAALESPLTKPEERAYLLVNRGFLQSSQGKSASAISDWNQVLNCPDSPLDQRAMALLNRADLYRNDGDLTRAREDATNLATQTEWQGMPQQAKAWLVLAMCAVSANDFITTRAAIQSFLQVSGAGSAADTLQTLDNCMPPEDFIQVIASLL